MPATLGRKAPIGLLLKLGIGDSNATFWATFRIIGNCFGMEIGRFWANFCQCSAPWLQKNLETLHWIANYSVDRLNIESGLNETGIRILHKQVIESVKFHGFVEYVKFGLEVRHIPSYSQLQQKLKAVKYKKQLALWLLNGDVDWQTGRPKPLSFHISEFHHAVAGLKAADR